MRFILLFTALFSMYAYAADDRPVPEPPPRLQSSIIDPVATYEEQPEMLRGALAHYTLPADLIRGEDFKTTHDLLAAFIDASDAPALQLLQESVPEAPVPHEIIHRALTLYVDPCEITQTERNQRLACHTILIKWRAQQIPQKKSPQSNESPFYCAVL